MEFYLLETFSLFPGSVVMIGKKRGKTCCVQVRNIHRSYYIQCEEEGPQPDLSRYNVLSSKFVVRSYAFGGKTPDISRGTRKYLKVQTHWNATEIPEKISGFPVLCSSRGCRTKTQGTIETFLISRGIRGPCWLYLSDKHLQDHTNSDSETRISRCTHEYVLSDYKDVAVDQDDEKDGDVVKTPELCVVYLEPGDNASEKVTPDADVVVGHHLHDLMESGVTPKLTEWNWSDFTQRKTGYVVCDLEVIAPDLIPKGLRSTSLSDISKSLNLTEEEKKTTPVRSIAEKTHVLELTRCLTQIAGNTWTGTLNCRRSERVDYLLSHEFHTRQFILPGHPPYSKKDTSYEGGKVLEPKKGLHGGDEGLIVLLDFKSLYPSVICEYGVCFIGTGRDKRLVLPEIVSNLITLRREELKGSLKEIALKLLVNSLYGCIGSRHSRFYSKELAAFITEKGRMLLSMAVSVATELGYPPFFGDTDSLAIQTKGATTPEAAREVASLVTGKVNAGMEFVQLACDAIYSSMFIVEMKMYAALVDQDSPTIVKGLAPVRHDVCPFAQKIVRSILETILKTKNRNEKEMLDSIGSHLSNVAAAAPEVPIEEFVIVKKMKTPAVELTARELKSTACARAYYKMKKEGGISPKEVYVSYVMCDGPEIGFPDEDLVLPIECLTPECVPNVKWYLTKQICPSVTRILQSLSLKVEPDAQSCVKRMLGLECATATPVILKERPKCAMPSDTKGVSDGSEIFYFIRKHKDENGAIIPNPLWTIWEKDVLPMEYPPLLILCPNCSKTSGIGLLHIERCARNACVECGLVPDPSLIRAQLERYMTIRQPKEPERGEVVRYYFDIVWNNDNMGIDFASDMPDDQRGWFEMVLNKS